VGDELRRPVLHPRIDDPAGAPHGFTPTRSIGASARRLNGVWLVIRHTEPACTLRSPARRRHRRGPRARFSARRSDPGRAATRVARAGPSAASPIAVADLSDAARTEWIAAAKRRSGIDVLINNAGSTMVRRFLDVDIDEAERMLRLDLVTPLRLTRAVLRAWWRGRGDRRRGLGRRVRVALLRTTYAAAKAGLAAASNPAR
jgi:NAD(P)-dependent dehydrogenase (short-subunit alcohol dehydrogenase family)